MLFQLFITFMKIGVMSFGGGYAMIPIIQHEVETHQWMSAEHFAQSVALAGVAPGPIATNTATLIGYKADGILGAIVSTIGMVLPSLVIVLIISSFFYKIYQSKAVHTTFYGLRPIVTGLIVYAAIHFGFSDSMHDLFTWQVLFTVLIAAGVFVVVHKYKWHPLTTIMLSALVGIAIFS
ncbi:chromate transporter [Paenibacillus pectinilyticus]|uniref:Chromate transporter n=1 Tax=Paenibacillus pectinilyticus TaxID=512399 RepID=A0A1C0ZVI1_9BACL|nr:chromate transporter [Paenibacillus pectinilyticus]OCT12099.1 chromate transporter [Paenibacillus pectinilyticus]